MSTVPSKVRPARSWLKISVTVDASMADAAGAYLSDLTGAGLEIANAAKNQEVSGNTGDLEIITGYLAIDSKDSDYPDAKNNIKEFKEFLSHLQQIFPGCTTPILEVETIVEEDWGKKWKSFFTSFSITPTLVIKPSWEEMKQQNKSGETDTRIKVIEMDPGLAFGTGHHASTQLALLLLDELFQQDGSKIEKILDVGTGSGILAMACGLFGAGEVLAIDNDPDAVETAKENITRNRLEERVSVSGRDIASLTAGFDIIVANITHDILSELSGPLARLVKPEGFLVLSGILKGQQEESIRQVYTRLGMKYIKNLTSDEWTALEFKK